MSYDLKLSGGDLVLNNGQLQKVEQSDKLAQDILKICLTPVGANPLQSWYGSFISRTMIGNAMSDTMLITIGESQLNTALENLKNLQAIQLKSFQRVSAEEQIAAITDISINRNAIDPREFNVRVSVLTKSMKPISTGFKITTI